MAESFLEDQLKRIRELSERMSRATQNVAELNEELARNREASQQGPLHEVRDLRTYSSTESGRAQNESKERSQFDAGSSRRHTARESSRRRR